MFILILNFGPLFCSSHAAHGMRTTLPFFRSKLQFLLTPDRKHVKLNDFNRMEVMLWNDQDQEYCRYRNGPGQGEVWKVYFTQRVPFPQRGDAPNGID
jgi:hypothetical protein